MEIPNGLRGLVADDVGSDDDEVGDHVEKRRKKKKLQKLQLDEEVVGDAGDRVDVVGDHPRHPNATRRWVGRRVNGDDVVEPG